jgi:hypothetical protein
MTSRARLPNRRAASTFNFEVGGLRYTATVGRFHDGRIGELFLQNHKSDSSADTNARDAAIAFSFAVQHFDAPCLGTAAAMQAAHSASRSTSSLRKRTHEEAQRSPSRSSRCWRSLRKEGRQMNTTSALTYVTDGREAIGFVLKRGRSGFEGFDRQERSLGLFKTAAQAANAVFDATSSEEGADEH